MSHVSSSPSQNALEVLCNEPWCCILCWQFDMQFSYATHLAHPFLCRPTHFNISGYASEPHQMMSAGHTPTDTEAAVRACSMDRRQATLHTCSHNV